VKTITAGNLTAEVYPDRDSWLAGRKAGEHRIGASTVAAVLGVSPWRSPWEVFSAAQGVPENTARNDRDLTRGQRWEGFVRELYAEKTGAELAWPYETDDVIVYRHDLPWLAVSPDHYVIRDGEKGGLEIKTDQDARGAKWGEDGTVIEAWGPESAKVCPPHYALQVYGCLAVTGLPWWDLVVLLGGYEIRVIRIMRDEKTQAALVRKVGAWRQRHLIEEKLPIIDGSGACRRHLGKGGHNGERRSASDEEESLVAELARLQSEEKTMKRRISLLRNQIMGSMDGFYGLLLDGGARVLATKSKAGEKLEALSLIEATRPDLVEALREAGLITTKASSRQLRLYGVN